MTDQRGIRGGGAARVGSAAARQQAAVSARGSEAQAEAAQPRPSRRRREVRNVANSRATTAAERVLGPNRIERPLAPSGLRRQGEPAPLQMAPRSRVSRMSSGSLTMGTGVMRLPTGTMSLPRPHVSRPQISRPHISRSALHLDRLIRSRLWIAVLAIMLVGIVGLRVEVLKLGTKTGAAVQTANEIQSENALLQMKDARLSNPQRIESLASRYFQMVQPDPTDTKFLSGGHADVDAAIGGITKPDPSTFEAALAASERTDGDTSTTTAETGDSDTALTTGGADTVTP